jgi:adenylate cyclase
MNAWRRGDTPPGTRIERILLGGRRKYTRHQVAEKVGVPTEQANRLWRSLGFATVGDDEVVFTDNDVEALRTIQALVDAGIVDVNMSKTLARVYGQHLSRLAEGQVRFLRDLLAEAPDLAKDERTFAQFVNRLVPDLEQLQNYAWRRHLAAHSGRMLAQPEESPETHSQVIGFADMVGYTSFARRANEEELSLVLETFETNVAEAVADNHGRVVKMLGDEVLFVADTARDGIEIALTLVEGAEADEKLPSLRSGLAYGLVLHRFGDVYGSTVNIASRLTSLAAPGRLLVDSELANALADDPNYVIRSRRPVSVRGFSRLKNAAIRRATA